MQKSSLFSLNDQVAVITGGSGVLGSAMALALRAAGARVVVLGRSQEKLNHVLSKLKAQGGEALVLSADVTATEELEKAHEQVMEKWGQVDILINAAGGNIPGATIGPDQSFLDISEADLRRVMELNYLGTVLPTKAFLPGMISRRQGNIINISSMAAQRPLTRVMGYASSKAAIDNYTKWLAVELAQKWGAGMRVNAIAPGFFLTEQNRTLLTEADGSLTARGKQIIAHTPFGRFGSPEDLNGTLLWLCSKASAFVTGTVIPVDGGFSAYSGV